MKRSREVTVAVDASTAVTALIYDAEAPAAAATLILAHGAGAGQQSPFIVATSSALAARGLDVITFNFPYTQQGRRLPDRRPILEACYLAVVETVYREVSSGRTRLFIGGKSMGGRIATHLAADRADLPVAGLVLLGYPLHPPGRPEQRRDAHLHHIHRPVLIVQGSRDAFGTPEELQPALDHMSPRPTLHIVEGGDHSFKVARVGRAGQAAVQTAVESAIAGWIASGR